jgi:hypothetical protein
MSPAEPALDDAEPPVPAVELAPALPDEPPLLELLSLLLEPHAARNNVALETKTNEARLRIFYFSVRKERGGLTPRLCGAK